MIFLGLLILGTYAAVVPVATFDGKDGTTYEWNAINDPVMGGRSHSKYELDAQKQRGHWWGAVEIVPALDAPGFCNLQAPPYGEKGSFKDISGATNLVVTASQINSTGLTAFNTMLMTSGAMKYYKQGVYVANLTLTDELVPQMVPIESFRCTWRGEDVNWCPPLSTQLGKITNIGLGTYFPGIAGSFEVFVEFIGAEVP